MVSKPMRPFCLTASVVWAVIGVPVGCANREAVRNSSAPSTATQHTSPTMCLMIALLSISLICHARPRGKGVLSHLWPKQFVSDSTLDACLAQAPQAVGDSGHTQRVIQTRHGYGYSVVATVGVHDDSPGADGGRSIPPTPQELEGVEPAQVPGGVAVGPVLVPEVPLKQQLIALAQGNPFFLGESVQTLIETGGLGCARGAYRLGKLLQTPRLPATVQAVLAARIDRLPPQEKQLLQTAAVIGREVSFPMLQAIAELSDKDLSRSLSHLQAAEFLYETRLFPEHEFTFKHALTQQVAYETLLRGAARAACARCRGPRGARWGPPDRPGRTVGPPCPTGRDVGQGPGIRPAGGGEGLRIAEAMAHPASLMYASHGIGLLSLRQGDLHGALPRLERAIGLCQEAGLPMYFHQIAAPLGAAYALAGRGADAVTLLTQAIEQSTAMEMVVFQVSCRLSLGEPHLLAGHLEEAQALAGRALVLTRAHQERGDQAYALRLPGDTAAHRDPPAGALAESYYRQAVALAEELGMRPLLAHCHLGLGSLHTRIGRPEHAQAEISPAIGLYRAMDMTFWLPQAEAALSQVGSSAGPANTCHAGVVFRIGKPVVVTIPASFLFQADVIMK